MTALAARPADTARSAITSLTTCRDAAAGGERATTANTTSATGSAPSARAAVTALSAGHRLSAGFTEKRERCIAAEAPLTTQGQINRDGLVDEVIATILAGATVTADHRAGREAGNSDRVSECPDRGRSSVAWERIYAHFSQPTIDTVTAVATVAEKEAGVTSVAAVGAIPPVAPQQSAIPAIAVLRASKTIGRGIGAVAK